MVPPLESSSAPSPHVSRWALGLLSLTAVQFAAQPMLTRALVSRQVVVSSLVLTQELVKLAGSLALLAAEGRLASVLRAWTPRGSLRVAGLPAATFAVQGCCMQLAYRHLDSVVVNLVNQTKLLFTAWFVFALLGRGQSPVQRFALGMLFGTAALVCCSEGRQPHQDREEQDFRLGLCCAFAAAVLSGFGAAATEWALCGERRDAYLFSAELSVVSILAIGLSLALGLSSDAARARTEGLYVAWTPWTLLPTLTQGLAGILVGLVTKVAGSVRKNFAVVCGLVLTGVLQWLVERRPLSPVLFVALPLVAWSLYLHTTAAGGASPRHASGPCLPLVVMELWRQIQGLWRQIQGPLWGTRRKFRAETVDVA